MNRTLTILFFLFTTSVYSQIIGISSAYLHNRYFNIHGGNDDMVPGNGFLVEVGLDSIKFDSLDMFFTLRFENYSGFFYVEDPGFASQPRTIVYANVNKSVLGLGMYFLNEPLFKKGIVRFGFVGSFLVADKESDFYISPYLQVNDPSFIRKRITVGGELRLSWPFSINDNWKIAPFYSTYFVLFEFKNTPLAVSSWRNYGGVSLVKEIK